MANYLFKKSFQLKTFKPTVYNDLWGNRGVFSTIRIVGKKPKYILVKDHIKNINLSLKKLNINFTLSEKKLLLLILPLLYKIKRYNHLLRVAVDSKIISVSLRDRLKSNKNFDAILFSYQRSNPLLKNLYYKKILKKLLSINIQKTEIILYKNNILLEGCTTNIFCIRNKIIYIPRANFYEGTTMNYLLRKTKRVSKKINIFIDELYKFDEILLVGSGKGVISLESIDKINWKPKSNLIYEEFLNLYKKLV